MSALYKSVLACGKKTYFLTNNFTLPALTITELYRKRWQIDLFFKWIKQHLRIKVFMKRQKMRSRHKYGLRHRLQTGSYHQ
jgi:IS4 transposase